MNLLRTAVAATLLSGSALAAAPAVAQMQPLNDPVVAHPDPESLFTSPDPVLHRNKQAALHIVRELLQCNQWERAGEWLTERYIQHNPLAASGLDAVKHYFINVAQAKPTPTCDKLTNPVVSVVAEGDMVTVLFKRELPIPGDPEGKTYTTTWFDAWRFVDGKADQHWDPATLPSLPPPQAAAPASADSLLKQAADRAEIEQLMWDYVRATDTLNPEKYVAVFTEDGAFNQTRGRDALHKFISDLKTGQEARRADGTLRGNMYHVMANQNIEFIDANHARVHYYWQTVFATNDMSSPPNVAAAGRGQDDVVRVNGKWLIKQRNVVPTEG